MPTVAQLQGFSVVPDACERCEHPWEDHVLHARQYPYPTDGWITCPVAGCPCYGTWSVDEESRPLFEQRRAEHVAQGGEVEIREPDT
jgi:hypothetical protein